jgi:capsule polysaccharide export protein KpsE/RkpR
MDDIINRFDLRKVYRKKSYFDARKILAKRSSFDEDKKSGMISITVMDHDPNRARDIAQAYIDELNKLLSTLTTSSARRERIFLEDRLKSIKNDVDATSKEFSQFSSRNATFDVQNEGQAILGSAGKLQGELIAAESELSGLRSQYTDDNNRVRAARARISSLQSQLRAMSGTGADANGTDLTAEQFYPSLRKLPLLGVRYFDLYHRLTMQQTIYELLTRQYELAKVQEAKDIPPVRVLDAPVPAEKKVFPPRTIIVLLSTLMSLLLGMAWLIARQFLQDPRHTLLIPASLEDAFRSD